MSSAERCPSSMGKAALKSSRRLLSMSIKVELRTFEILEGAGFLLLMKQARRLPSRRVGRRELT
jgi:hypothetical protein